MIKKISVIAHDNFGARSIFDKISDAFPDIEFQLVITTGLYYKKGFVSSVVKMLKEASFRFCLGRFIELCQHKFRGHNIRILALKPNVVCFETDDVNSDFSYNKIKAFSPDLILSTFTMHIVGQKVIDLASVKTIGTHPSILPSYKGLEVFFWQLANNEAKSGCSVFLLDTKIDNGKVFLQHLFEINKNETVESLYRRITLMTSDLLIKAIELFSKKEPLEFVVSNVEPSYYPMPTSKAYRKFKKAGKKWK